jgi:hypothetical protein
MHFDNKAGWTGQDFLNGRPRQRQQRALKFSQVCTQSLIGGLTGLCAAAYVGFVMYGHFEETASPIIPFVVLYKLYERAGLLKSIPFATLLPTTSLPFVTNHYFFEWVKLVDSVSSVVPHSSILSDVAGCFSIRLKVGIDKLEQA